MLVSSLALAAKRGPHSCTSAIQFTVSSRVYSTKSSWNWQCVHKQVVVSLFVVHQPVVGPVTTVGKKNLLTTSCSTVPTITNPERSVELVIAIPIIPPSYNVTFSFQRVHDGNARKFKV